MNTYKWTWIAVTVAACFGLFFNAALMTLRFGRGELRWWFRGIGLIFLSVILDRTTSLMRFYATAAESTPFPEMVVSIIGASAMTLTTWGWLFYVLARNGRGEYT